MKRIDLLKSKKGMTLVELIGSLAIISLLSIFLITVFMSAVTIVSRQAKIKKSNAGAAAVLENKVAGFDAPEEDVILSADNYTFRVVFGGTVVTKDGSYYKSKDSGSDYTYYYFISD